MELHDYIARTMPWQDPGNLRPEEYWAVTAYMLKESGIDPVNETLNPESAARIRIAARNSTVQATKVPATNQASSGFITLIVLGVSSLFLLWGVAVWKVRSRRNQAGK